MECGFSSIKSFNTMFKSKTGSTPSEERKKDIDVSDIKSSNNFNYLEILEKNPLKELQKYLDFNVENNTENIIEEFEITRRIRIDLEKEPQNIRHTWKNLITVASASHILDAEIQNMLKETQREIGFKYIRFHGIFNDDMLVVHRKPNNELDFNFNKIGMLVDFLLSIGLKPFFELGFMPTTMASGDRTVFYSKNNVTMPKQIDEWNSLVRAFVSYLKNSYGIKEVSTWYFEFWNEPEVVNLFGFKNVEDYFLFYKETFYIIKEIDKNIKVGGPSILLTTIKKDFFSKYTEYCVKNMCLLDFFTVHSYPFSNANWVDDIIIPEVFNLNPEDSMMKCEISENEDDVRDNLRVAKEIIKNTNVFTDELYVTEWNSTPWHRDLCSDTTYKSAYIVKNICGNMDAVDGLGYCMLSDYSHEIFPSKNLFHGGLGLFTYNGIKKTGYNAYKFLAKLGSECIDKGKTHYVTKEGDNYQILLFNYCHYNKMYRNFDTSIINLTNRKGVFEGNSINIQLIIDNVESSLYKIKISKINSKSGSSYDEWLEMGAPETLMYDDVNYLKVKAEPSYTIINSEIALNFEMQVKMEKNEVVLIELVKN